VPQRHVTSRRDPELVTLAGRLLEGIEAFADDIVTQIQARVDFYASPTSVSTDDLRRSCRGNAEFVLRSFREEQHPDVTAARETGRRRAEQGVPLPVVMAAFRVGFSQIWQSLVEHARREGRVSAEALVDAASDIWSAHDTFAEAMAASHRETAMQQILRDERERSALVAALLEGKLLDEFTVWDVADVLRLPKRGPFIVVAAESPQIAQEALPDVENRLRGHGIGSAWRLLPDAHVGIVRLTDERQLAPLVELLTALARGRTGLSPAYPELTETAGALRFARIALASTPSGKAHVTQFDDYPLAVAAVSAPDAMRRVRQTVLGGVLELPAEQRELLLDTLVTWRDNGGSATATARVMFCHPNTIRHRLRRLEAVTGRSLTDPRATAELFVALDAALLGPDTPAG
jgi:hypothetical protein